MENSERYEKMIAEIAFLVHEKFRELYRKKNNGTRIKFTKDKNWIKKHGTDRADLAKLNYSEIPGEWQKSRWLGSKAALDELLDAIKTDKPLDKNFIEYASNSVHEEWLNRNRRNAEEEHKHSYKNLSEDVKEKDRIFVRAAMEIFESKK